MLYFMMNSVQTFIVEIDAFLTRERHDPTAFAEQRSMTPILWPISCSGAGSNLASWRTAYPVLHPSRRTGKAPKAIRQDQRSRHESYAAQLVLENFVVLASQGRRRCGRHPNR